MTDKHGTTIKNGDLIIHGGLGQLWLIYKKDNKLTAIIVSDDSGYGYSENLKDMGAGLAGNATEIIGRVPARLLRKE